MDSEWFLETKKADFAGIAARFGIDQVTARILRNRDIVTDEQISMFLNGDDGRLYDPRLMMNAEKAAEMIAAAIKNRVHIRIIGDYDVDGVCSAYILLTSIKRCGGIADAAIPHRVRDGYGINETLIDDAVRSRVPA
jgi:single-stranded-DNA-specific exonuclease